MSRNCVQEFELFKVMEAAKNARLLAFDLEIAPGMPEALSEEETASAIRQAAALGAEKCCLYCRDSAMESLAIILELLQDLNIQTILEVPYPGTEWKKAAAFAGNNVKVGLYCSPDNALPSAEELAAYPTGSILLTMLPLHEKCEEFAQLYNEYAAHGIALKTACMTADGKLPGEEAILLPHEAELLEKQCNIQLPGCLQLLCACSITYDGKVYPCMAMETLLGDLRSCSLEEIFFRSKVLSLHREHPARLKKPCSECSKSSVCAGCAARAYKLTGDFMAADKLCSCNHACQDEIKSLPMESKGMLPHAESMLLIDRIVYLTELYSVHEAVIRPDNPLLRSDGVLEPNALPEYAAQAAALRDSVEKGGKPSPGLLCEVSKTRFFHEVKVGDLLTITVSTEYNMDIWYGIKFTIAANGITAAEGCLKLCIYDGEKLPY